MDEAKDSYNESIIKSILHGYNRLVEDLERYFPKYVEASNSYHLAVHPYYKYGYIDNPDQYIFIRIDDDENAIFRDEYGYADECEEFSMPLEVLYNSEIIKRFYELAIENQEELDRKKRAEEEERKRSQEVQDAHDLAEYARLRIRFGHIPWPDGKGFIR